MLSKRWGFWIVFTLVIAVLALSTAWAVSSASRAQAAVGPAPLDAYVASPDGSPFTCIISEIFVATDRIHVRCTPGDGAIAFFATSASADNMVNANRFLTILNTAYALGKKVTIYYDPLSSHNPAACQASDCRKINALLIQP